MSQCVAKQHSHRSGPQAVRAKAFNDCASLPQPDMMLQTVIPKQHSAWHQYLKRHTCATTVDHRQIGIYLPLIERKPSVFSNVYRPNANTSTDQCYRSPSTPLSHSGLAPSMGPDVKLAALLIAYTP